jgi:hypothetical protein
MPHDVRFIKTSIVITTNRGVGSWGEILGDTPSPPPCSTGSSTDPSCSTSTATPTDSATTTPATTNPAAPPPAPANHHDDQHPRVGNFTEHNWGISVSAISCDACLGRSASGAHSPRAKDQLASRGHEGPRERARVEGPPAWPVRPSNPPVTGSNPVGGALSGALCVWRANGTGRPAAPSSPSSSAPTSAAPPSRSPLPSHNAAMPAPNNGGNGAERVRLRRRAGVAVPTRSRTALQDGTG